MDGVRVDEEVVVVGRGGMRGMREAELRIAVMTLVG